MNIYFLILYIGFFKECLNKLFYLKQLLLKN